MYVTIGKYIMNIKILFDYIPTTRPLLHQRQGRERVFILEISTKYYKYYGGVDVS